MNDVLQFGGLYPHAKFQFSGWYWFSTFLLFTEVGAKPTMAENEDFYEVI